MESSPTIGMIYDTLFSCTFYYSKTEIRQALGSRYNIIDELFKKFNPSFPNLPDILGPYFLYNDKRTSAIINFFDEQIDFKTDNIDIFCKKIIAKSDVLYTKIVENFFLTDSISSRPILPNIAPESFIRALIKSDYSSEIKLQLALLFGNFNYSLMLLVENIQRVYGIIELLHKNNEAAIIDYYLSVNEGKYSRLYESIFSIQVDNLPTYIALSYLNPFIVHFIHKDGIQEAIIGMKHEETLQLMITKSEVDLRMVLTALGNDTRLSILNSLQKHEEMTCADIARDISQPTTTVLRHVEVLFQRGLIYISKKSGLQVFYKINYSLLSNAIALMSEKIGGILHENDKCDNHQPEK